MTTNITVKEMLKSMSAVDASRKIIATAMRNVVPAIIDKTNLSFTKKDQEEIDSIVTIDNDQLAKIIDKHEVIAADKLMQQYKDYTVTALIDEFTADIKTSIIDASKDFSADKILEITFDFYWGLRSNNEKEVIRAFKDNFAYITIAQYLYAKSEKMVA